VRIDGTNGVPPRPLADAASSQGKPAKSAEPTRLDGKLASVPPAQLPYVHAALASEEVNSQAVEEARKLLESGQLDTPEAILGAAKAILDKRI